MGCAAFRGNLPRRDNAAVWALREAGAVILCKTVTTELGASHPWPPPTPSIPRARRAARPPGRRRRWRRVPVAIGSQVGGSIVRPTSCCGNVALKPTQGAINRGERQPTTMSTHGPHAGSIKDIWLVAIAIAKLAGGDPGRLALTGPDAPPRARRPERLIVMETEAWPKLDGASRGAFETVVERLRAAGVSVLRRGDHPWIETFERAIGDMLGMTAAITNWENHWLLRNLVAQNPESVSARSRARLAQAGRMTPQDYMLRLMEREEARRRFAALAPLADAVISMSSPGPAPLWSGDVPGQPLAPRPTGDAVFNAPRPELGAPVVTVPLTAVGGMPMGIQVMARPHMDAQATAIARWMLEAIEPVEA
jgi:Asp-tRNA(Asn)/Glu-tRNA(Gln) amidotransferase A subunit family amidase